MPSGNEGSQSGVAGEVRVLPVLSGEPEDSDWQWPRGYVSEHFLSVLGDRITDHHVYMCGPPPMLDATEKIVLGARVLPANVHADKFYDRSHSLPRG